jgi:shikimate kinase
MTPRHVVLVGLPGVGKSTVGRLVSEGLPAPLIDIDQLLVREVGRPVDQIIGMMGEPYFRQIERKAVLAALDGDPAIIVPGGGWAAQPGMMETAARCALVIYLKCTPSTAVRRTEEGEVRPLLAGVDPVARMGELLKEREPFYRLADHEVMTGTKDAAEVAKEVITLARSRAGWM